MLIGGTTQLVSNAMPTGGASLFIASGASAIAQTGVDTLETIIRGEKVDVGQTFIDLGLYFVTTLANNYLGGKMIPTNPGWLQPQKFWSVFIKPYGQKILL